MHPTAGGEFLADANKPGSADDPYDLGRFVQAQEGDFDQALSEIRGGRKESHWMWYVFPQFDGLGSSSTSKRYSIKSVAEAAAYLGHPVLGPRLRECAEALLRVEGQSASEIFGFPDDVKLKSCATLFACVSLAGSVFERLLDKYFHGERDGKTLRLLGVSPGAELNLLGCDAGLGNAIVNNRVSPHLPGIVTGPVLPAANQMQ